MKQMINEFGRISSSLIQRVVLTIGTVVAYLLLFLAPVAAKEPIDDMQAKVSFPVLQVTSTPRPLITPTPTATITTTPNPTEVILEKSRLENQKLGLEIENLREVTRPTWGNWVLRNLPFLFTLVVGGLGAIRWFADRSDERKRRAEDSFVAVVEDLGSESQSSRVQAAVTLRTFLHRGYEDFYAQVFNLSVVNLRLLSSLETLSGDSPSPLAQSLTFLFRESFPLARDWLLETGGRMIGLLDATGVQLRKGYLARADLSGIWMPHADLSGANLERADLAGANLMNANLARANLEGAKFNQFAIEDALKNANLEEANLTKARLDRAELRNAVLIGAHLNDAVLTNADLTGALLHKATLIGADLAGADLSRAILVNAILTNSNIERAKSLKGVNLSTTKGLLDHQIDQCVRYLGATYTRP